MIPLDDLIHAINAEVLQAGDHTIFEGFAHDSRAVAPGDCFVAVHGMHSDGHDFATDALERGAAAALLERGWLDTLRETRPEVANQHVLEARKVVERQRQLKERRKASNLNTTSAKTASEL